MATLISSTYCTWHVLQPNISNLTNCSFKKEQLADTNGRLMQMKILFFVFRVHGEVKSHLKENINTFSCVWNIVVVVPVPKMNVTTTNT